MEKAWRREEGEGGVLLRTSFEEGNIIAFEGGEREVTRINGIHFFEWFNCMYNPPKLGYYICTPPNFKSSRVFL